MSSNMGVTITWVCSCGAEGTAFFAGSWRDDPEARAAIYRQMSHAYGWRQIHMNELEVEFDEGSSIPGVPDTARIRHIQ
jgi:hypothetical protein